jgi:hypothetical protein
MWDDLSAQERKEMDWVKPEDQAYFTFVRYRGSIYCLDDSLPVADDLRRAGWEMQWDDTYFSAIVGKYVDNGGAVVMGIAFSENEEGGNV